MSFNLYGYQLKIFSFSINCIEECDREEIRDCLVCDQATKVGKNCSNCGDFFEDFSKTRHVACRLSHVICLMSNAYVDPWNVLNNFRFHVYAQMLLFKDENVNAFFLTDFLTDF